MSGIVARRRVRAAATLALLAGLAWWQWSPAIGDVEKVSSQPAAHAPFFRPLLDHLAHAGGPATRVEIPFTKLHWEAAAVAPRFPLARGWERQLDIARNGLFYGRAPLTAATYETWLEAHAVGWVALARTDLDYSAQREAALIGRGLPYLKLRWRSRDWRLYEFTGAHALVISQGGARLRLARLENGAVVLAVARPGRALVRVAWSPYWELRGGCVEQAGQWTQVEAHRTGLLRMSISFSLARVFVHGRRCGR